MTDCESDREQSERYLTIGCRTVRSVDARADFQKRGGQFSLVFGRNRLISLDRAKKKFAKIWRMQRVAIGDPERDRHTSSKDIAQRAATKRDVAPPLIRRFAPPSPRKAGRREEGRSRLVSMARACYHAANPISHNSKGRHGAWRSNSSIT
jgi:hypothetical protein